MQGGSKDIGKIIKDLDKAAELRVKIVVWKNLRSKADAKLGQGTITEIVGADDYR